MSFERIGSRTFHDEINAIKRKQYAIERFIVNLSLITFGNALGTIIYEFSTEGGAKVAPTVLAMAISIFICYFRYKKQSKS